MARIGFGHGQVRRVHLVEAAIDLRPKDRAPSLIEGLDRSIARRKPEPKAPGRRGAIADGRIVAAIFIVGLPSHHGGMLAIALGNRLGNPSTFCAVTFVRKAIVTPGPELAPLSPLINRHHIRVLIHQPFWRGCGRGA